MRISLPDHYPLRRFTAATILALAILSSCARDGQPTSKPIERYQPKTALPYIVGVPVSTTPCTAKVGADMEHGRAGVVVAGLLDPADPNICFIDAKVLYNAQVLSRLTPITQITPTTIR